MTLFLLKHSNYYNRIIKRYSTIEEYKSEILKSPYDETEKAIFKDVINFNPNDGISTTWTVNWDYDIPDYLIVTNDEDKIDSRWWVIEAVRNLIGQYTLTLYRDVISDWYDDIVGAPCFIEKATLGVNNPLIFNNENMTYNQIKKSETLIKDRSGTSWYAVYCKNTLDANITIPSVSIEADFEVADISVYEPYRCFEDSTPYIIEPIVEDTKIITKLYDIYAIGLPWEATRQFYYGINVTNLQKSTPDIGEATTTAGLSKVKGAFDPEGQGFYVTRDDIEGSNINSTLVNDLTWAYNQKTTSQKLTNDIPIYAPYKNRKSPMDLTNNIVRDIATNKLYKITVNQVEDTYIQTVIPEGSRLFNDLLDITTNTDTKGDGLLDSSATHYIHSDYTGFPFEYETRHPTYSFDFLELHEGESTINIPVSRRHCLDAAYDVLLIPGDGLDIRYESGFYGSSSLFAEGVIKALLKSYANDILDIQRIPYTTISDKWFIKYSGKEGWYLDAARMSENLDFVAKTGEDALEGFIFFPQTVSKYTILQQDNLKIPMPTDATDLKVMNECDMYRVVSPNFNGQFEFSAAKNGGVSGYTVTLTLIPYQPYIKVAPIFGGMYGQSFNDARGMICGGDFSITQTTDEWQNYIYNNKNYQEIFNRQIENMDFNNSMQLTQSIINAVGGTVSAGASGAATGLFMSGGNPLVAAGVGAASATVSAGAGIADIALGAKLRNEAMDYTKDQFGYQLGNIKAIPYNITKISSVSSDNKIFPFVEHYTCTDTEKNALIEKITYNGMTVNVIGSISDYQLDEVSYIKGKLIRLENICDDYHVVNMIAEELNKGVYI